MAFMIGEEVKRDFKMGVIVSFLGKQKKKELAWVIKTVEVVEVGYL